MRKCLCTRPDVRKKSYRKIPKCETQILKSILLKNCTLASTRILNHALAESPLKNPLRDQDVQSQRRVCTSTAPLLEASRAVVMIFHRILGVLSSTVITRGPETDQNGSKRSAEVRGSHPDDLRDLTKQESSSPCSLGRYILG